MTDSKSRSPGQVASIPQLLRTAAKQYGEAPALSCLGHTLSFSELDTLADRFACWLQGHTDLNSRELLTVQLSNLLVAPVVYFGILRAGMVVVNANPLLTVPELERQVKNSGARVLITLDGTAGAAAAAGLGVEYLMVTSPGDLHPLLQRFLINQAWQRKTGRPLVPGARSLRAALRKRGAGRPWPVLQDLALVQYTGGTTGEPKGVMLGHDNICANVQQMATALESFQVPVSSRVFLPLPLYHIYAFTTLLCCLHAGHHIVLLPDPRDTQSILREWRRQPCHAFFGLNTLFANLCAHPKFKEMDFSNLRMTISGGMALQPETGRRWQELTGSPIYEGYGLTETSPVVSLSPGDANRIGAVGPPLEDTEVRVVDQQRRPLPAGERGELEVRGPQVMRGYWRRPEATAEVLDEEGWLRTGDIAELSDEGYIRIVDRAKDMVIVSGFNVYPAEVEKAACTHPAVAECVVVGVPDEKTGEAVKLVVVPRGERPDPKVLQEWCRKQLTAYKVPSLIEFRDELPKSGVGKVLRRKV